MFVKKILKKQFILSFISFGMLSLVIIGSSTAIYVSSASGNSASDNVGTLNVAFSNNSGSTLTDADGITITEFDPMTDAEGIASSDNVYGFAVSNSGNIPYAYTIALETDSSYLPGGTNNLDGSLNLLDDDYIRFCLVKVDDSADTITSSNCIPHFLSSTTNGIIEVGYLNAIDSLDVTNILTDGYKLKIWVADAETYLLPNDVLDSEIHLKITISGSARTNPYEAITITDSAREKAPAKPLATPAIIATLSTNTTLYNNWQTGSVPGTNLSGTSENGLYAVSRTTNATINTEDENGRLNYVYRGKVTNNYVSFAGKCWRITSVDAYGNIKLILYNNSDTCVVAQENYNAGIIGSNHKVNSSTNANAYAGLMYGVPNSNTFALEHAHTNDSTLLTSLKTWYDSTTIGTTYKDYLGDAVWCNDISVGESNNLGYGDNTTYYGFEYRYVGNFDSSSSTPTLKCTTELSRYTQTDLNINKRTASATYEIATITADEMIFAGSGPGIYGGDGSYITEAAEDWFWTMTPTIYSSGAGFWAVSSSGGLYDATADTTYGMRPMISLKSSVTFTSTTNGSAENPYTVVTG